MPKNHEKTHSSLNHIVIFVGIVAAYIIAGKLGLLLGLVNPSATAVWAPTGIAIAALLIFGRRLWSAVFLAAFIVNLTTAGTFLTSLGIALGNTLEAVLAVYLVNRFANGKNACSQPEDIFKFIGLAAILSTMVSATIGVTTLYLAGLVSITKYGAVWLTWWIGDSAGAIIVAPLILILANPMKEKFNLRNTGELITLLISTFLVAWLVFGQQGNLPLEFLCAIPLIWAAFRFNQRETITVVVIMAFMAVYWTLKGNGVFARNSLNESLLLLQTFMAVVAASGLSIAAAVSERRRVQSELLTATMECKRLQIKARVGK